MSRRAEDPAEWGAWIMGGVPRLAAETVPIHDAVGRTLAEDVYPAHALPLWPNSAMDGYALRAADTMHASPESPATLEIVGEVAAGSADDPPLGRGRAVRIMTGAPVPTDADAVVAVEETSSDTAGDQWASARFTLSAAVQTGAHIRRAGEDIPLGTRLAGPGDHLTPARASALAAAGVAEVRVAGTPRVAVVVTGSELQPPGGSLRRGQIPESNSVLIAGLVRDAGLTPVRIARSADDAHGFADLLRDLSRECDAIITTGGVGPGRHDIVRIAMDGEPGVRQVRVAIRPGQPQCAGPLGSGAWIFALPGNPVSAAVSFELFVRPALLAMQGRRDPHRTPVTAIAATSWRARPGNLQVLPVSVERVDGRLTCRPSVNPRGVSHAVGGHGGTDGYALIAAGHGDVSIGDEVSIMLVPSW